jgi:hypothetical protein
MYTGIEVELGSDPCSRCREIRTKDNPCAKCPYRPQEKKTCPTCGKPMEDDNCCYIVSACLDDLGIPRNSQEMQAMKQLTKEHILNSFSGKRDYVSYGRIGPKIVDSIRSREDSKQVWGNIYKKLTDVASVVFEGKYEEGHQQYKSLVLGLEKKFVTDRI